MFEFDNRSAYVTTTLKNSFMSLTAEGFSTNVDCCHHDWQVFSMAQNFNALSQIFSVVEHLSLSRSNYYMSSAEHNEVDRTEWPKLVRSSSNVTTLYADQALRMVLYRCLRIEDGEHPLELLSELGKLTYSGYFTIDGGGRIHPIYSQTDPQASMSGVSSKLALGCGSLWRSNELLSTCNLTTAIAIRDGLRPSP